MMKWLLMLMLAGSIPGLTNGDETIPWRAARRLTWNDFKAKPDTFSSNAALTSSGIVFQYKYNNEGFNYSINCVFEKTKSWGKVKTAYILSHEQAHFDISEWHARKLYKALREYRFNEKTVARDLSAIYDRITKEQTYYQTQYDEETSHSRNRGAQARWLEKIKIELDKLKSYAGYYSEIE